ncbi:MAG: adenylate/guanylate cyclase domain-containing protein [Myxococcota bacterium]
MATFTRTVVFTDLVNYTEKTARADRETLRQLISRHEQWTREVCEPLNGRLVKGLGDAFLTLFDSATDGLRACIKLAESGLPDTSFQLRASAATGDVELIDGDIFGEAVNLASRLSSMTPGGQVWFTESTRRCANLAEIPWEPAGVFTFKGIPEETPCFRAPTPSHCVLPESLKRAARLGTLLRVRPEQPLPTRIQPSSVVLFEGFQAGSDALKQVLGRLPVLDPAQLWMNVYTLPPLERRKWTENGRGLVIGTPLALERALEQLHHSFPEDTKQTVFIDAGEAPLELVLSGLALPTVPLGGVIAGYSYDMLADGTWMNESPRALLRVDVGNHGVSMQVLGGGIVLNGRAVHPGARHPLDGSESIRTPAGELRFHALQNSPYLGVFELDTASRLTVNFGETAELGRNPNHPGVGLPDRGGQSNLRWCSGDRAQRTRSAGFTLDRALVGRRQAAVSVDPNGDLEVKALHHRLATYLYRSPGRFMKIERPTGARIGDLLVMGTNVVALRTGT